MARVKRVLIPLAPGFEIIEAATVLDILRRVRIDVTVAGVDAEPIAAMHGVQIVPDVTLDEVRPADFDMLVILGGDGALRLRDDARVRRIVVEMAARDAYLAAICRGPVVLAAAGVLDGKRVTSSPSSRNELAGATYVDERVVVDGNVITSQLPGTAMEFALKLVAVLCSERHADYVGTAVAARS
jgi:4-methyl-5(b-hydroxyethyl)-thiazole monophosphate biosynthesis